jgi:hypothetical protein
MSDALELDTGTFCRGLLQRDSEPTGRSIVHRCRTTMCTVTPVAHVMWEPFGVACAPRLTQPLNWVDVASPLNCTRHTSKLRCVD